MEKIVKDIKTIVWSGSSHGGIQKKIIFKSDEFESATKQVAYTELSEGDKIDNHFHESMEEIFFLISGKCEFIVDDQIYILKRNSTIKIPAKSNHSLRAITNCRLFYFGVAM